MSNFLVNPPVKKSVPFRSAEARDAGGLPTEDFGQVLKSARENPGHAARASEKAPGKGEVKKAAVKSTSKGGKTKPAQDDEAESVDTADAAPGAAEAAESEAAAESTTGDVEADATGAPKSKDAAEPETDGGEDDADPAIAQSAAAQAAVQPVDRVTDGKEEGQGGESAEGLPGDVSDEAVEGVPGSARQGPAMGSPARDGTPAMPGLGGKAPATDEDGAEDQSAKPGVPVPAAMDAADADGDASPDNLAPLPADLKLAKGEHAAAPDGRLDAQPTAGASGQAASPGAPGLAKGTAASAAPAEVQFADSNHEKIVTTVRSQVATRGGTMEIRMDPPELGALKVMVEMRDGVMTATFQTSNEQATQLLSHSLNQLKHVLESQGVSVERLQVQQAPKGEQAKGGGEDGQQQQQHDANDDHAARQEQQRKEMLKRMWRRVNGAGDPVDYFA